MGHITKKFHSAAFLLYFVLCSTPCIFGQSNAQIESELVASILDVQKYSHYGDSYDEDKLSKAQDSFEQTLLKYSKVASTLQFEFSELNKYMFNATSKDGKFRIYSWDLEDGGTMHNFARIYQYQAQDGKVYSEAEDLTKEDAQGGFVTDIFPVNANNSTIYIVCSTLIASNTYNHQSADLFKIEGTKLISKVNLIKTKSGVTSSLSFAYDFFSVVDRKERPIRLISFDDTTQTLHIPVVIKDQQFPDGRVTDRLINYRFNGTYFEKD